MLRQSNLKSLAVELKINMKKLKILLNRHAVKCPNWIRNEVLEQADDYNYPGGGTNHEKDIKCPINTGRTAFGN